MMFSQQLNSHRILKRLAKALISLRVCSGWSEPLLVAHTTLLEISCQGSLVRSRESCLKTRSLGWVFKHIQINPTVAMDVRVPFITYRLFNVLRWLWNIYEGAELPSVYFITNTKHCITYLALTQLFPVLVSHPEMYTLCSILLHFV